MSGGQFIAACDLTALALLLIGLGLVWKSGGMK